MKALFLTGDRTAELRTVAEPELSPGKVILRTLASAICGSDLPHYRLPAAQLGIRSERIPGHEAVGIVERVAPDVSGVALGDRVMVYHHSGCGSCRQCRSGMPMFCRDRATLGNHAHGCNAERIAVPAQSCLPLPAELSVAQGVLLSCNFGTAFSGVRKMRIASSETVAVFGLGPVGCCVVMNAAAQGARVIGIDPTASRRDLALSVGATSVLDPGANDPIEALRRLTEGNGPEVVIDCSAFAPAQLQAMEAVASGGRVLLLGANTRAEINPGQHVIRKELEILGSWVFKPGEYDEMVRWLKRVDLPMERIITHRFRGDQAVEAYRVADSGAAGKVLVEWAEA